MSLLSLNFHFLKYCSAKTVLHLDSQEEVELLRADRRELARVAYRADDQVEIAVVVLDLGPVTLLVDVLDRERVEPEDLEEELAHWGPRVRVLTVDGAQGLEFDMVVLSTVCTRFSRFLDDGPRVNVAISRARFALVVVGHRRTLLQSRFLRQVARDAVEVDGGDVV